LVGYWHNFDNGSGLIQLANVDNTWDVIVIAFADDAGNGSVKFVLDPALNKAQFIADVATKRTQGKKVVLSFGGQNGTVTLNNATNVANFVSSTNAILNEYGFDGIDIDLESGAGVSWGAPVVGNLVTAVKQLKATRPSLYLSMAPEHPYVQGGFVAATGIWGAYLPLIDGLRAELNILHVQLYNNGGLSTPYSNQPLQAGTVDMMVGSVLMLIEGFPVANNTTFAGLRPDQVAFGLPSGAQAANSGQATIADINRALNCVTKLTDCGSVKPKAAYPSFRGVMTWSINWDVRDGRPFSVPLRASLNALP
jgi:chitinase